ncbi:MAG: hypothetical protein LLG42_05550 [Chloroflexi bacterium]|nr:hypothetical protein [Chloroflexota bacterium]
MPKWIILSIMVFCIGLSACVQNADAPSGNMAVAASITPDSDQNNPSTEATISAEDVVYSFLTAYENNPDEMILYLGDSLKESLPAGGIQELLGLDGTLEGLVFTSGSSAPDTHLATVEAHMQTGQKEVIRTFTLEWQENTWQIIGIEQAK